MEMGCRQLGLETERGAELLGSLLILPLLRQQRSELIVQLGSLRLQFNSATHRSGSGAGLACGIQGPSQCAMRFRIVGRHANRLARLRDSRRRIALVCESVRKIHVRLRQVILQSNGGTKLSDSRVGMILRE